MRKNVRILLLIAVISSGTNQLMAQWIQCGPDNGPVNCLASINNILFAGTDGGLFISADSANSWTYPITSTSFFCEMTSFAVMDTNLFTALRHGGFFRSDNNGSSWISDSEGLPSQPIVDLAVLDSWIFAGTNGGGIYRSGDLGANWIPVNTGLSADTITTLAVIDTVLFAGTWEGGVFQSSDNGDNWVPVTSGLSGDTITAFAAKGTQLFAVTSSGKVFRSSDNGDSWSPISTVPAEEQVTFFTSITFIDNYMFAGTSNGVYRSTDNGEHWTAANDGMIYRRVNALHTLGGDLFAGTGGGIYRSSNQGESWTDLNSGMKNANIRALVMDETKMYASTMTGIYLSGDGGENWEPFLEIGPIFSLAYTTEYFYAGSWSHLFITSRSSTNWNHIHYPPDSINRICSLASRDNIVYMGTEGGGLFRVNNYGPTFWESLQIGFQNTPVNCLVFDGATIYAGTGTGVYSSSNGGLSWTTLNEGLTDLDITALTFKGADLFAGTGSKGVFRSTDHGANWTPANNGMEDQQVLSFAVKGESLFAGTFVGGVLHSTDNGANWITISHSSIFDPWVKIPFTIHGLVVDNTYLYAGDRKTGVWRRPLSELITSVPLPSVEVNSGYTLEQNFPNPFHTSTKIRFSVPCRTHVVLKVFDQSGRDVTVLVNKDFTPGTYEESFDGKHLSNGIYYYQMQAGEFIQTRKIMLLR
jgi:photosystem II stability/assembly factor-like uncharacterized protein